MCACCMHWSLLTLAGGEATCRRHACEWWLCGNGQFPVLLSAAKAAGVMCWPCGSNLLGEVAVGPLQLSPQGDMHVG
jgi:hypothetical protein